MERCDACGYDYGVLDRHELSPALQANADDVAVRLTTTDAGSLRAHPIAGMWSALEYGCHLRDVFTVQRERVGLALESEQPSFASMRRDERVAEERYNEQEPSDVAAALRAAARDLAATFDALDDAGWLRTGVYNWPVRAVRTVEWIGRHTVHEAVHHIGDIDRLVAAALRGSSP